MARRLAASIPLQQNRLSAAPQVLAVVGLSEGVDERRAVALRVVGGARRRGQRRRQGHSRDHRQRHACQAYSHHSSRALRVRGCRAAHRKWGRRR